ncbi:hypothetical protein IFM89_026680 [Coptis chinensis]|uniref:RRM domain-containing protein n=1 Tax=Coptis chinensis TaxID=261450 RepID=A0A835H131_9MAGN|nr:hypothetical protein IFM89_026680 [Coptis chinensis]
MDDEWRRSITSGNMVDYLQQVMSIKIIRNKITQQPEGYCFVEFASHGAAEQVLQTYNDTLMPGTDQPFRLNWASFGIGERCPDVGPEHSIFVGDLASDVTDYLLQKTFQAQHRSVRGAKVVTDPNTGRSKGYGFVKFSNEMERNCAMSEMNGVYCSSRPMHTPKKATGFQSNRILHRKQYIQHLLSTLRYSLVVRTRMSEEEPRQIFTQFSDLVYAKQYRVKDAALCGLELGNHGSSNTEIEWNYDCPTNRRLSWGRSMMTKQAEGTQFPKRCFHNFIQSGLLFTSWFVSKSTLIVNSLYAMLNYAYLAVHGSAMVGRLLWLKTSALYQQA